MFVSSKIKTAYCYNFKLMFFLYAMISCKHSISSAASSTSGSTTISTSVSTQSTTSSSLETTTNSSPTSVPIDTISTPHSTSISPTLPTTTATSTSVSTTLSPSVSTTTSSPSSLLQTATSTSGTIAPSSSTSPTTTATSTLEPTTSSSSASSQISSTSETTKISSPILTPAATSSSDTAAFSSSASLTTTSTTTSESTTLSQSASTTTTSPSTSETIKVSLLSSPPTTTTSASDTTAHSSSTSLTTISTSMSESTTLYLSASTTTTSSLTSENTTISSPTSEITTPSWPTSPATTATLTFKSTTMRFQSTTMSLPPNSIVVDIGSHTLGLNFSIRVNLTFMDEYKNKTSPGFVKLAADFTEQLTTIYKKTPGFKYIQINEFRNGSVDANYTVIVSASTSLTEVMDHINRNVIVKLWDMSINGGDVDNTYINQTMAEELDALESLSTCEHSTPRPCPYGFNCRKWISGKVLCSDRCVSQICVHGTCYIDHQNELLPKCRCPKNDDGYVYSGDRCEHKSLSTLIIITSAVGGGVLVAAFFIVCLICIKTRRNKEQQDTIPLDNLPNYSKYFHRDSTYQPQYGYDLPRRRIKSIESRDWEVTPRYIPDSDDGHQNECFFYQENETPSGDYVSDPIREKHTYNYIGANTKYEIRRPQFR